MIKIGQCVYYLLSGATAISDKVGTKIYPVVVPEDVKAPIIVYERRGDLDYNKDSVGLYRTLVDVTVLTENYKDGVDLADSVRTCLEYYHGTLFGTIIKDVEMYNVDETYTDGMFVQKVSFTFKTN